MGANCCVAAKERPQPCMAPIEVSAYRLRHSPSWSFRWDNRTHIEDIMENNTMSSNHSSVNIHPEVKNGFIAPSEGHTSGDNLSDKFCRVKWQQPEKKMETFKILKVDPRADESAVNNIPLEHLAQAHSCKSADTVTVSSDIKTSKSLLLADSEDPSSSMNHSILVYPNSTRKAHQLLYRQILGGNIQSIEPFSENSSAERSSNSMLSACSNDMFAGRLQGESSDGWSTCKPSELVATSQRDRWSVDSELFDSIASRTSRSNASQPTALALNQEVCKLCSRLLKERPSWNGHELAVAAILFCGHAYHANCLASITAESEKYDPSCPVCIHGEACTAKLFRKLELEISNKTSKIMADSDLDWISKHQKKSTREPRMSASSSMKDSSRQPFLRRHFSTGSRPPGSVLGGVPTRLKSFWSSHWRE